MKVCPRQRHSYLVQIYVLSFLSRRGWVYQKMIKQKALNEKMEGGRRVWDFGPFDFGTFQLDSSGKMGKTF